jgi:hypothetical protein
MLTEWGGSTAAVKSFRTILPLLRSEDVAAVSAGVLEAIATAGGNISGSTSFNDAALVLNELDKRYVFTMDSAVLGSASLGCGCCMVLMFGHNVALEDAFGYHGLLA